MMDDGYITEEMYQADLAALEIEEESSVICAYRRQFEDEVEYQVALATSYPQDATAANAAEWLRMHGRNW